MGRILWACTQPGPWAPITTEEHLPCHRASKRPVKSTPLNARSDSGLTALLSTQHSQACTKNSIVILMSNRASHVSRRLPTLTLSLLAAVSAECLKQRIFASSALTTSASSKRAATSAAPGTGIVTRARCVTLSLTCTCQCSKKPASCRPTVTRLRLRFLRTASNLVVASTCTRTRFSRPKSRTWSGMKRPSDGPSPQRVTMCFQRSSSSLPAAYFTRRSSPVFLESRTIRASHSTRVVGITSSPAAARQSSWTN
ncbi:unannotated protein [freshwater metagenome]|uniref:Unannotated protein n=1 Tax=freshwater metagenome TaxID=449393 RepID=A0A6J6GBE9_9ZZZZ